MIIKKLLNNNVVIASNENEDEVVAMGIGLGFKVRIGDPLDQSKVQKIFVLKDYGSKLNELIKDIPIEYLEITEEIVDFAKKEFNLTLKEFIYLSLTDHIHFAIVRQRENMNLDNPFLHDVKQFYRDEYKVGLYARKIIKEKIGLIIPDDEVGYIAMHIAESAYDQDRRSFEAVIELVNEVIDKLMKELNMPLDRDSLKFNRLIIHVRHFARRYIKNEESAHQDELLDETIMKVFPEECKSVEKLSLYLEHKYGRPISTSEKNYLIIHLRNCKDNNSK